MREILFRGKNIETGEWVYGNYIKKIDPTKVDDTFWAALIHDRALTSVKVDPATVGQFTGLVDENGVKIFEGDIIALDDIICPITWDDGGFQMITSVNQGKSAAIQDRTKKFYIIGNIHDTPQEGGTQ